MRFDIITIFPSLFASYFSESLLKKAMERRIIDIRVHDLRKWSDSPHKTVDDRPFGGGSGMVMKVEPVCRAVSEIKDSGVNSRVILFTPRGKKYNQRTANRFTGYDQLIMICGRYEGVDERISKHIAEENISIGNYVLMGGEVPAMAVVESVARLIPGVVGKEGFLDERVKEEGFMEYPQYTRPEIFNIGEKKWRVPRVLLSGDHKKIEEWKKKKGKIIK